jgi:hypothetical protein
MSFDNVPKPAQLNLNTNNYALFQVAQQTAAQLSRADKISAVAKTESALHTDTNLDRSLEGNEQAGQDHAQGDHLTREEREHIIHLARLRGLIHFTLGEEKPYRLQLNPATGMVELVEVLNDETGDVVISLTPEELVSLARQTQRFSGLLEDTSG